MKMANELRTDQGIPSLNYQQIFYNIVQLFQVH